MHPAAPFRWQDREAMRAMVRDIGFGQLFADTPDGPRVAHVPVVMEDEAIRFHLSRGNALTRHLDGRTALFVVNGPDAYVSPDWYGIGPDQVPTWNYLAVELEGPVTRLDRRDLEAQIDDLSAEREARLAPKTPWTRAKANPATMARLIDGIAGFRLTVQAWRGTIKLGQNKPAEARHAVADALDTHGQRAMAHLMREAGA
jgi:transcriptional regulator